MIYNYMQRTAHLYAPTDLHTRTVHFAEPGVGALELASDQVDVTRAADVSVGQEAAV